MAYENNHYVPQFILKKYGDKINRFNIKTGEYICGANLEHSFSKNKLYDIELEKEFGVIESKFGKILKEKILIDEKEISLKRNELDLIKRFLLIEMLRVPNSFNSDKFINSNFTSLKAKGFTEVKVENETTQEHNARTIRTILNAESLKNVYKSETRTYESIFWALLYNSCYLTIWDSKDSGEDFIITDIGMTCEHEPSKFYCGLNEELVKPGYCLYQLDNAKSDAENNAYFHTINLSSIAQANFYMFSISETRMIGLINPFFRLYYEKETLDVLNKTPDTWPSLISKEALRCNRNKYKYPIIVNGIEYVEKYSDDDLYIYDVKSLPLEDVIYINNLMLDRVDELIGFVESNKIIKSLNVYTQSFNPRVDYSKLKEALISYGYEFSKNKKYIELGKKFNTAIFTERDNFYIEYAKKKFKEVIDKLGGNK